MPAKKEKVVVRMFLMPFDSKKFNEGQKVWVQEMQCCTAAKITGKFRSDGEYVTEYVAWDCGCRDSPNIKKMRVDFMFADRRNIEYTKEENCVH